MKDERGVLNTTDACFRIDFGKIRGACMNRCFQFATYGDFFDQIGILNHLSIQILHLILRREKCESMDFSVV